MVDPMHQFVQVSPASVVQLYECSVTIKIFTNYGIPTYYIYSHSSATKNSFFKCLSGIRKVADLKGEFADTISRVQLHRALFGSVWAD